MSRKTKAAGKVCDGTVRMGGGKWFVASNGRKGEDRGG